MPPVPATAPQGLSGTWTKDRSKSDVVSLKWSAVPGAVGYVIYRSQGVAPSFVWPKNFLTTLVETTYTDMGNTKRDAKVKGLDKSSTYSYQVTAVNAGGVSPPTVVQVPAQ